jgi:uncharacterized membrane-anchored protein
MWEVSVASTLAGQPPMRRCCATGSAGGQPKFAANAFFFQEKQGKLYPQAKYGEFRVAPDGEALLVALRGADLQALGPKGGSGR